MQGVHSFWWEQDLEEVGLMNRRERNWYPWKYKQFAWKLDMKKTIYALKENEQKFAFRKIGKLSCVMFIRNAYLVVLFFLTMVLQFLMASFLVVLMYLPIYIS